MDRRSTFNIQTRSWTGVCRCSTIQNIKLAEKSSFRSIIEIFSQNVTELHRKFDRYNEIGRAGVARYSFISIARTQQCHNQFQNLVLQSIVFLIKWKSMS